MVRAILADLDNYTQTQWYEEIGLSYTEREEELEFKQLITAR
jgi:hypothetical protein